MKVLFIDAYNLMHRSRFGYATGDYAIVYTFFRSLRSMVSELGPDKTIFVLEGMPKFRFDIYPDYKANRKYKDVDPVKAAEIESFGRQKHIIIDIISRMPIEVLKHPDYEGDDLIGTLVNTVYRDDQCIVASADTDFIQILYHPNNFIYNPIKKCWVSKPDYDYLKWKAMVGDTSDNIVGISRVGPKTAEKILKMSSEDMESWMNEKPERRSTYERNLELIRFSNVPSEGIISLSKEPDSDWVRSEFEKMGFNSIISDKSWNTFFNTFWS